MPNEAHVRIDEGIKRGKRAKPSKTALEASGRVVSIALRPLHNLTPEERQKVANAVLDRYINGEQVANIAPEYNVSDVTIYALLLREHESAWKDIQTARALARLESAQDRLEHSQDALSLARARESVRSAQWELERLLNRLYGQKQELTVTHTIPSDVLKEIGQLRQELGVSGEPVSNTPNAAPLPVIDVVPESDKSA